MPRKKYTREMLKKAIEGAGSLVGAGKLLGISRQQVHQLKKRFKITTRLTIVDNAKK